MRPLLKVTNMFHNLVLQTLTRKCQIVFQKVLNADHVHIQMLATFYNLFFRRQMNQIKANYRIVHLILYSEDQSFGEISQ